MFVSFFSFISLERKNYYRNRVLIHPYKYRRIEFPRISFKSPRFYLLVCGWITRGDRCFETMNENEWFLGRNAAMLITSRYVISVSVKSFHVSWGRHVSKAVNATARTCVRNVIKIWNCLSAEGERERERERLMPRLCPLLFDSLPVSYRRPIIIILPRAIAKSREIYLFIRPLLLVTRYPYEGKIEILFEK